MATKNNYSSYLSQLEHTLETYLIQKAPGLPTNWKEFFVKVLPWIIIIFILITLPALLAAFGIGALLLPISMVPIINGIGFIYYISLILFTASTALEILALPGLFNRSAKSWKYIYYSVLLGAVGNLITFNIFSFIIGSLLSLYILFQIRSYYK